MIESIIILAVICAVQSVVLCSLMVALVRFIDQRGRVDELRRDVDHLDKLVDPMYEDFKRVPQ